MGDVHNTFNGGIVGPVNTGNGTMYNGGNGTQYIAANGDQHLTASMPDDVTLEIAAVRAWVHGLTLSPAARMAADQQLMAAGAAPDRSSAADHLKRLLNGLQRAGALASAGTSTLESLQKIAAWLGPAAGAIAPWLMRD